MALISGTIGFVFGGAALTWLANPLLFVSWKTSRGNLRISLITSFLASIISLSFLLFKKVISDEAGSYSEIVSYGVGYWLWVASILTMFVGNTISYFRKPTISSLNI